MEFNFSQKTDPETGNIKIVIEGDKQFVDVATIIKNSLSLTFMDTISQLIKQSLEKHEKSVETDNT